MSGWHHRLDGHEFEWTVGVGDGQGGQACCDSRDHKESDATEQLNWTDSLYKKLNKQGDNIQTWHTPFPIWNQSIVPSPVPTVGFLTCKQVSQEAGQVVWHNHLLKKFPQFVVIHTVRGFGIVNKAEVDVFLEFSCFSIIQWMLAIWSLVPLPFLNPDWTAGSYWFTYCWSLVWRILSITLLACEMSAIVQ